MTNHDTASIERLCTLLRQEIAGFVRRTEVFDLLPMYLRAPVLERIGLMLEQLQEGVGTIKTVIEQEIVLHRGDSAEDQRRRFREASGG